MWGRDREETKGSSFGMGTISPGEKVILVDEWDVRALVEWGIQSR